MAAAYSDRADRILAKVIATAEGRADPYPLYAELRAVAPVYRSAAGIWVLSRYDDCQRLLRHPAAGKGFFSGGGAGGGGEYGKARQDAFRSPSNMFYADPPDHSRLRALLAPAFTARTLEGLRPRIVEVVDKLLDSFHGEVDVMETLAFPLPVAVIGEMLGVPPEDRDQFRPLARAAVGVLEMRVPPDALAEATAATAIMEEYFDALVAERRARPRDDLLTRLIGATEQGDPLSHEELISTAILVFVAGFETTTYVVGNSLLALLRHPDQLDRLRRDRTLLRPAVEELLRYDGPAQFNTRIAYEDLEIGRHHIEAGSRVVVLLGSANRDPDRFTDPDRLDVGRSGASPLSFGSGIHYCLGAALGRLELQVVIDRLLERFTTMELLEPRPVYHDRFGLRGLVGLPVRFGP